MEKGRYGYAVAFFVLLGIVDSILTYHGVSHIGLVEGNVLTSILIEKGWSTFFFFKIAVYGLLAKASLTFNYYLTAPTIAFFGAGVVSWNSLVIILSV